MIRFDNGEVKFLVWRDLAENMGCRPDFFEEMYTYFSLYTHPSQVGVFQFQDMFTKASEDFKRITLTILNICFTLMSIFIADYIRHFSICT